MIVRGGAAFIFSLSASRAQIYEKKTWLAYGGVFCSFVGWQDIGIKLTCTGTRPAVPLEYAAAKHSIFCAKFLTRETVKSISSSYKFIYMHIEFIILEINFDAEVLSSPASSAVGIILSLWRLKLSGVWAAYKNGMRNVALSQFYMEINSVQLCGAVEHYFSLSWNNSSPQAIEIEQWAPDINILPSIIELSGLGVETWSNDESCG